MHVDNALPSDSPPDLGWGSLWEYPNVWNQPQTPAPPSCHTGEAQDWECAQVGGQSAPEKCPDMTTGSFATDDVGHLLGPCCPVGSELSTQDPTQSVKQKSSQWQPPYQADFDPLHHESQDVLLKALLAGWWQGEGSRWVWDRSRTTLPV